MPIDNYGVWVGRPVRVDVERAEDDPKSPHIFLQYDDGSGSALRAAINVKSTSALSELVFWLEQDFRHPILDELHGLKLGFHPVLRGPGGAALDYIRGNLTDLAAGRVLPHDRPGARDDIIDFVAPVLETAIARSATVYLFGEPFRDRKGIHDVHMNQGSQGKFTKYNGVWQDGGIVIHHPDEDRFSALFLAFASQAVHTDEQTGHGLPGSRNFAQLLGRQPVDDESDGGDVDIPDDRRVAIVAALVNPVGMENTPDSTGRPELVYLVNRGRKGVSLAGWSLLNRNDDPHVLSADVWLAAGEVRPVTMAGVPLANKGGLITLLDADGNKVDGVSYTSNQTREEGELVIFR